jgi:hypothetical protein
LLDMAPERCRPAGRNGTHDAPLAAAKATGVRLPKRVAVAAEDIRHLQPASHAAGSAGGTTCNWSRSSGLGGALIVLVATWV